MGTRTQLAVLGIATIAVGWGQVPPPPRVLAPLPVAEVAGVSTDDVAADLAELLSAFADLHPNPFWSRDRAKCEAEIAAIVASARATNGLDEKSWVRAAAKFVIGFDDPHCWVFVPGWKTHRDTGGRFFPLELRVDGSAATVVAPDAPGVPVGAKVVSINGEPVESLVREFRPLTGQADDPYGDEFLATFFRRYLWYFRGWGETFRVELETADGTRTVGVPGYTNTEYLARQKDGEADVPLSYRPLGDGIGLIEFRSCVAGDRIRELAEPIFDRVRQDGVIRLLIDARQNAGGGDDAWITLLEFLTDKPFSGYASTRYRISQRLKDLHGEKEMANHFNEAAWGLANGTEVVNRRGPDELLRPPANPRRFQGKWCVLAGRGSFSAGMSFVCAVKAFALAPVVGQETGGRVKGFGQWIEVKLPRTGLSVAVSTKQFDGAVDVPFRRGVPPDLAITPVTGAKDATVQAAIELLTEAAR